MKNRICILGLPRSGSQLVAMLIQSSTRNMVNLNEPFTNNLESYAQLTENNLIQVQQYTDPSSISLEDRAENLLKVLEKGDKNQPIVLRFFPYDNILNQKEIITRIKNCNFEFLVLKRQNIEAQVLSYGVALSTGIWIERKTQSELPDKLEIQHFEEMSWLYEKNKNFDNWLDSLDITYDVIFYENINQDLFKYLQRPVYRGKYMPIKRNSDRLWERITNADELKMFFQSLKDYTYVR